MSTGSKKGFKKKIIDLTFVSSKNFTEIIRFGYYIIGKH